MTLPLSIISYRLWGEADFITGGTFDKEYNELNGELFFKDSPVNGPTSRIDDFPITDTHSPTHVELGQPIVSQVTCGFNSHFADITFLNFEVQERSQLLYEIRAKARYENIQYGYTLPVVSLFDTTLTLAAETRGKYVLQFYNADMLVKSDTVEVH